MESARAPPLGLATDAQRIAQIAVDPLRLERLDYRVDEAFRAIKRIAIDTAPVADQATLLAGPTEQWDKNVVKQELASFDDGSPVPVSLPRCAQAVARRLQLEILREELPTVAAAVEYDEDVGANDAAAMDFANGVRRAGAVLSAQQAVERLQGLRAGAGADPVRRLAAARPHHRPVRGGDDRRGGRPTHAGFGTAFAKVRGGVRGLGLAFFMLVQNAMAGTAGARSG